MEEKTEIIEQPENKKPGLFNPIKLVFKKEGKKDILIEGTKTLKKNWFQIEYWWGLYALMTPWAALTIYLGVRTSLTVSVGFFLLFAGWGPLYAYFRGEEIRRIRDLFANGYTLEDESQMKYLEEQKVVPIEENSGIAAWFKNANKVRLIIWASLLLILTIVIAVANASPYVTNTDSGIKAWVISILVQFFATAILIP